MLLLIQILIYLVLMLSNIIHDAILINYYKRSPKHSKNVYMIAALVGLTGAIVRWSTHEWIYLIPAILYAPARWFVHDPLLNLLTGKDAGHIGKTKDKEEDSKLDEFLAIDTPRQFYFKGLLLIVMLVACIIIYQFIS